MEDDGDAVSGVAIRVRRPHACLESQGAGAITSCPNHSRLCLEEARNRDAAHEQGNDDRHDEDEFERDDASVVMVGSR